MGPTLWVFGFHTCDGREGFRGLLGLKMCAADEILPAQEKLAKLFVFLLIGCEFPGLVLQEVASDSLVILCKHLLLGFVRKSLLNNIPPKNVMEFARKHLSAHEQSKTLGEGESEKNSARK